MLDKMRLFYIRHYMGPVMVGRGRQVPNPNAGMPDLQVFLPDGRSVFFELKTEKGVVDEKQKAWLKELTDFNIPAYVIRSLEGAKEVLHKHLAEIAREAS